MRDWSPVGEQPAHTLNLTKDGHRTLRHEDKSLRRGFTHSPTSQPEVGHRPRSGQGENPHRRELRKFEGSQWRSSPPGQSVAQALWPGRCRERPRYYDDGNILRRDLLVPKMRLVAKSENFALRPRFGGARRLGKGPSHPTRPHPDYPNYRIIEIFATARRPRASVTSRRYSPAPTFRPPRSMPGHWI